MKYESIIRGKWIYNDCTSLEEMKNCLLFQHDILTELQKIGAKLDDNTNDDYIFLTLETEDADLAKKFGFHEPFEDFEDDGYFPDFDDNNGEK